MECGVLSKQKVVDWLEEYWRYIVFAIFAICIGSLVIFVIYHSAIQPKEGTVIRKDYHPPYTSTTYRTITQSDGTTTRIPMQEYHDATYQIVIKGINSKGEEDFGYYYVTPIEYENIKIGDYYIKQIQ